MKKHFTVLFFLNLLFLVTLGPYIQQINYSNQNYNNLISSNSQDSVVVYVNSSIYSNIIDSIAQYKSDIEADGYLVSVYNWSDSSPDPFIKVNNLKNNLTQEYNLNNITGAVLVGSLPYAIYENASDPSTDPYYGIRFPCDLFLMDLDGTWTDSNGNNHYDNHTSNSTTDLYPEIFIGRIDPSSINHPNQTQALIDYFHRNHLYRTNSLTRYNNSLMYIDNYWESTSKEWKGDMEYLYTNITLINSSVETTDAQNYIDAIQQPYEFVWSFIHSNHIKHGFDWWSPPSDTYVNSTEIASLNTKALFYNLYCCYAARFNETDNLATHYLFSSNYTLAVFGCTRSGGFVMNRYLYEPLSNGKTLGESFRLWWYNNQYHSFGHGPNDMEQKGNCLLGDPLLQIREASTNGGPDGTPNLLHLIITLCIIFGVIAVVVIIAFKKR